jgi:serine/threonine-protein kinase RsbT
MQVLRHDSHELLTPDDIVRVRQIVRSWAIELGLSLVDQTKMVTAASELARNTVTYGGGGAAHLQIVSDSGRQGLRVTFEDQGPGIADLELALRDGYTTADGLGLGLSGARRLVNVFEIDSRPGEGTTVSILRWKP